MIQESFYIDRNVFPKPDRFGKERADERMIRLRAALDELFEGISFLPILSRQLKRQIDRRNAKDEAHKKYVDRRRNFRKNKHTQVI